MKIVYSVNGEINEEEYYYNHDDIVVYRFKVHGLTGYVPLESASGYISEQMMKYVILPDYNH